MSCPKHVRDVPRERSGDFCHSRARTRRPSPRVRRVAAGSRQSCRSGIPARAWPRCVTTECNLRRLSHTRELHELPRGCSTARHLRVAFGRSRTRRRRACSTHTSIESHAPVSGGTWAGSERPPEIMRDLPRAVDVPHVSSPGRRAAVSISPPAFPYASSECGVFARVELQRLPQCGAVLSKLPSAVRPRRPGTTWPRGLP